MPNYSKRAQVLFTEEQYETLEAYAKKNHKPMGTIIREAVEKNILLEEQDQRRKQSAQRILSKRLPTVDWKKFKEELALEKSYGAKEEE